MFIDINIKDFLAFAISFKYVFRKTLLKPLYKGFQYLRVLYKNLKRNWFKKWNKNDIRSKYSPRNEIHDFNLWIHFWNATRYADIDRYMRSVRQSARKNLYCRYEEILRPIALLNRSLMRWLAAESMVCRDL